MTVGSANNLSSSYSGEINGAGSLLKNGTGTLILSGADSYDGGTSVAAGTLAITTASALPSGSSLVVGANGTFIFDPTATASPLSGSVPAISAGQVAAVPEPGTLALLTAALIGLVWGIRRRRD